MIHLPFFDTASPLLTPKGMMMDDASLQVDPYHSGVASITLALDEQQISKR